MWVRGIGSHIVLQGFCSSQSFPWEPHVSLGWRGGGCVDPDSSGQSPLLCGSPPPPTPTSPAFTATGVWICYYGLFLLETQHELVMALELVGGLWDASQERCSGRACEDVGWAVEMGRLAGMLSSWLVWGWDTQVLLSFVTHLPPVPFVLSGSLSQVHPGGRSQWLSSPQRSLCAPLQPELREDEIPSTSPPAAPPLLSFQPDPRGPVIENTRGKGCGPWRICLVRQRGKSGHRRSWRFLVQEARETEATNRCASWVT